MAGKYVYDGTQWIAETSGKPPQIDDYSTSDTWYPPADVVGVLAIAIAGGYSGTLRSSGSQALGGRGGTIAFRYIPVGDLPIGGITVTIGAGGVATNGNTKAGGQSSFGSLVIAPIAGNAHTPALTITAGSNTIDIGEATDPVVSANPGPSPLAAGAGGGVLSNGVIRPPADGGSALYAMPYFPIPGAGGIAVISGPANPGDAPGGGGGASQSGSTYGGDGAKGMVRVVSFFTDPRS